MSNVISHSSHNSNGKASSSKKHANNAWLGFVSGTLVDTIPAGTTFTVGTFDSPAHIKTFRGFVYDATVDNGGQLTLNTSTGAVTLALSFDLNAGDNLVLSVMATF